MLLVKIDIKSEEINNTNTVIASVLTIEVIFGEEQRRKITFDSRKKQKIRIGRINNEETDFVFEDVDVSRKQCMIIFEDNNWYIVDGDGEKPSSNGTWIYPEKYFNITDGLIVRIGTTVFECNIFEDNKDEI
jgi:pSer/pThr/pTyr-binding forkhead associated (FHA) protein